MPTGAPLFVIINPGSGEHDSDATRALLARVFEEAGRPVSFAHIEKPSMLAQACREAAAQASRCGGILVAAGGDGTINSVAQAALEAGCPLGVIPQGTFNYVARDHGIPAEPEEAARALLCATPKPTQVGTVNGQVFLVNASLGLYPQLLQDREKFKSRLGRHRWVAILAGLATIFEWRRQLALDIELDQGRTAALTPTLIVANNALQLERIGMEAEVTASLTQGRLAGVVTRPIGTWTILGLALRGALGRLGEADQVHSFTFQRMSVRVRGMRRVKVATDGEVRTMVPPLQFSVHERSLQLMVPAPADQVPRE